MHQFSLSLFPLFILLLAGCGASAPEDDTLHSVSYLGQTPPGMTPERFAPGEVSTDNLEIEGVFTPEMNEFYFVRQVLGVEPRIYRYRLEDNVWLEEEFSERIGELFISVDGQSMFLGNQYRERTDSGWSEPQSLGPLFEGYPIMRLTASANETYVFDEREEYGILRYSQRIDGVHQAPEPFGPEINSGRLTAHPFIAPDESYLIWDSERDGGYGESDLYISFRKSDGFWGPAINMGPEVNTEGDDTYGTITPDGKYFFFQRIDLDVPEANIFWMDAQFIEDLRTSQ